MQESPLGCDLDLKISTLDLNGYVDRDDATQFLARINFLIGVRNAIERSARRELIIFTHGFSVGFTDAIKSAAQLAFDTGQNFSAPTDPTGGRRLLGNQRAVLAFDWASCASGGCYGFTPWRNDRKRTLDAGQRLAELLAQLAGHVSRSVWLRLPVQSGLQAKGCSSLARVASLGSDWI